LGVRANSKEERHEKEGQEEIEGNIKKCNARKVRLTPPAARKAEKEKRPPDAGPLRYCTEIKDGLCAQQATAGVDLEWSQMRRLEPERLPRSVLKPNHPLTITALDGTAPQRFIAYEFDSVENAQAFNNSSYMKEVNAMRDKTTQARSFIVEGMPQ
jgi:hypothetical protein